MLETMGNKFKLKYTDIASKLTNMVFDVNRFIRENKIIKDPDFLKQNTDQITADQFVDFVIENEFNIYDLERWAYRFLAMYNLLVYGKLQKIPSYTDITTADNMNDKLTHFAFELFEYARRRDALQILFNTIGKEGWISSYAKQIENVEWGSGQTSAVKDYLSIDGKQIACYSCGFCGTIQHIVETGEGIALYQICPTCSAKIDFTKVFDSKKSREEKIKKLENQVGITLDEQISIQIAKIETKNYSNQSDLRNDFDNLTKLLLFNDIDINLWFYRIINYMKNLNDNYELPTSPYDIKINVSEIIAFIKRHYNYDLNQTSKLLLKTIYPKNMRFFDADPNESTTKALFCLDCGDAFKVNLKEASYLEDQEGSILENEKNHRFTLVKIECESCQSLNTSFTYKKNNEMQTDPSKLSSTSVEKIATALFSNFSYANLKKLLSSMKIDIEDIFITNSLSKFNCIQVVLYCQRREIVNLLIEKIKNFKFSNVHAGELRNVKCEYCGTIQTKAINSNGMIEGICTNCAGTGYKGT